MLGIIAGREAPQQPPARRSNKKVSPASVIWMAPGHGSTATSLPASLPACLLVLSADSMLPARSPKL